MQRIEIDVEARKPCPEKTLFRIADDAGYDSQDDIAWRQSGQKRVFISEFGESLVKIGMKVNVVDIRRLEAFSKSELITERFPVEACGNQGGLDSGIETCQCHQGSGARNTFFSRPTGFEAMTLGASQNANKLLEFVLVVFEPELFEQIFHCGVSLAPSLFESPSRP